MGTLREGLGRLQTLPRAALMAVAAALVGLTAILSIEIRTDLRFSFFYLIPISLVSWLVGRRAGFFFAVFSAGVWVAANLVERRWEAPSEAIVYWNGALLFSFFLTIALLLSALRQALDRETALARSDPLTRLANRRAFFERADLEIQRAARYGRPFTVAYLDIDDFKRVNDRYGHLAGDRVLLLVADTIREVLRSSDGLARLGGDEFVLLLPESSIADAQAVLGKVHAQLEDALHRGGWDITISIGALTFQKVPDTVEQMLKMADALMYSVKRSGKNRLEKRVVAD
ncbi:MAG TPA: GGDEF domain-containing protein [Thermoanaerobaculia bacterium]|nr:GGDEF domain-containing protein [Thermoanaerobaculia bacterium]